ncbi:MAG: hypothetical protein ACT4OU_02850 [Hyphomicrobium sp.]
MATTFIDLTVMMLWPLVVSSAVWAIATYALAESDEIEKVVDSLIQAKGVQDNVKN